MTMVCMTVIHAVLLVVVGVIAGALTVSIMWGHADRKERR